MAYLNYISDENLIEVIKNILHAGLVKKESSEKDFHKNVVDPFAALFESVAFDLDYSSWKSSELVRQSQKTLQNQVGDMSQKILGKVVGWEDLGVGNVVDLVNHNRKIIAEIKNKYNTVSGGVLVDYYNTLESLILPKTSTYKDYTAYFVNIIPKKSQRIDKPFQPSNKNTGRKSELNEKIRIVDGVSFYDLVTGEQNSLKKLFEVLPQVIDFISSKYFEGKISIKEYEKYTELFDIAFFNN